LQHLVKSRRLNAEFLKHMRVNPGIMYDDSSAEGAKQRDQRAADVAASEQADPHG